MFTNLGKECFLILLSCTVMLTENSFTDNKMEKTFSNRNVCFSYQSHWWFPLQYAGFDQTFVQHSPKCKHYWCQELTPIVGVGRNKNKSNQIRALVEWQHLVVGLWHLQLVVEEAATAETSADPFPFVNMTNLLQNEFTKLQTIWSGVRTSNLLKLWISWGIQEHELYQPKNSWITWYRKQSARLQMYENNKHLAFQTWSWLHILRGVQLWGMTMSMPNRNSSVN